MNDQSETSHLQVLFEAALQDYQKQTGMSLAEHPLAEKLENCDSVESVTAVLCEQTQSSGEFWRNDKVLKPLKAVLSVLHKLSAAADFGRTIGMHFPPVTAIHTGLGVLLSVVKSVNDSYDLLVDLLESFENFLRRLDIYTKITPTVAMTEMVVKILVELLSTLALATKQIKEGKAKKLVKKLLGEKDVEAVLQRLGRLTQEEAQITAAQTLEVVYGLFQNTRVVMDDGKASADNVTKALEIMQRLANDMNESKRDKLKQDIFSWLLPPDPWKNFNIACESRHPGSAEWFIQGNIFSEWKSSQPPSSLLWVHGKPGAGKSVFCSRIIEELDAMQKEGLASLAIFYCDFREDQKKELRGLLSSLLIQLSQFDPCFDKLSKFYLEYAKSLRRPSDDALVGCLKDLLKLPGLAPVYLIVDGLDECPNTPALQSPRAKVLNFIKGLIESSSSNLRICISSRQEVDIKKVLNPLIFRSVSLHDQREQETDIKNYINSVISTHPNNTGWEAEHRQLVMNVLTEKADGMFRWVECQMDRICSCIPSQIQEVLADLPETLDETYERTLRMINQVQWEFVHRLLQFVAVASRPLRVEELAELLAFDFKTGPIPKFREGWRLKDPVDAVLSKCSSLLAIVDGEYPFGEVIQFAHFSVKEFLTSDRLAEASDITPRRYHVSMAPAHTLVAQACLGILLHLDEDVVTSDSLEEWPLAEYAAEHWVDHARFGDVLGNVEDGMKQLFNPNKHHPAVCVWIYDPIVGSWRQNQQSKRSLPHFQTSLHYAAFWGFHSLVDFLVIEGSQNVRSEGFINRVTPLHLASECGHMKAARTLIEHGAGVMAQNEDGETPLHLASRQGNAEVARMLTELGADVTVQNKDVQTPLHLAMTKSYNFNTQVLQNEIVEVARILIERGADVSAQNKDGQTPLHLVIGGSIGLFYPELQQEVARLLIGHGANLTSQNKYEETPLRLALGWGDVEFARMLIEYGADATSPNNDGRTLLHLALGGGRFEFARMLIEHGANVTSQDKGGDTPLHLASQKGQVEVARILIECGADVTPKNKDGETPLHLASRMKQAGVARMLIERGADVSAQDKNGQTPLHLASQWELAGVARMLIERGADVSAQDKYGQTPLHRAFQWVHFEVARMLIEHGADVMAQMENGQTALHLAWTKSFNFEPQELQNEIVEVARMLIERGANVTSQDKNGNTPLHLASQLEKVEPSRMLIERGADVTTQNKDKQTPLHLASREGQVEVTRMLIECGADVTAQNGDGNTPLHSVSVSTRPQAWKSQDYATISDMLLKQGADINARNNDGLTPFRLASQTWFARIAEYGHVTCLLLEYGADPDESLPSESPPVTSPAHSLVDLPIPSQLSQASPTTLNATDTDLPQSPSPFSQPPSNDTPTLEAHQRSVFFTRRFLCSLGILAIAVALSFFIRSVPQTPAVGRSA